MKAGYTQVQAGLLAETYLEAHVSNVIRCVDLIYAWIYNHSLICLNYLLSVKICQFHLKN